MLSYDIFECCMSLVCVVIRTNTHFGGTDLSCHNSRNRYSLFAVMHPFRSK